MSATMAPLTFVSQILDALLLFRSTKHETDGCYLFSFRFQTR